MRHDCKDAGGRATHGAVAEDAFRPKVGYWLESVGLREGISGGAPESGKIFAAIRVKNEASGCSTTLDFRKKSFYSSYTPDFTDFEIR
jgi:hypothetical protein